MLSVRYNGRLGNQLFQYALGRRIAEELGLELKADPIPGFPRTHETVKGARHLAPEYRITGNHIDLPAILADDSPRHIVLDGYFQHHSWCWPERKYLRDLYPLEPLRGRKQSADDVVVNVRRTDYIMLEWALPLSFYQEAIERSGATNIWIVTDDRLDPFFWRFRKYRPRYFSGSALEQIRFMAGFKKLVLSQSTFSWWPVALGDVTEAFSPLPKKGCWAHEYQDSPDLIPDDRPFIPLSCLYPYEATRAEAAYQELRRLHKRLRQELCLSWRP